MQACAQCGGSVEERFRFCPWCAAPLRRKLVEFFPAHPRDEGKALRVESAVSVDEFQAARVARFLRPSRPRPHGLSAALKGYAAELRWGGSREP